MEILNLQKINIVNESKKTCLCASCDFRDIVFSYLDESSIEDLCIIEQERAIEVLKGLM